MGYGEVGGDDSVQVNVWLRDPDYGEVELAGGSAAFDNANAKDPKRLSNDLKNRILPLVGAAARCFAGKDKQGKQPTDTDLGDFTVTIHFRDRGELATAQAKFQQATGTDVQFTLKVLKSNAGQIQIEWD